MLLESPTYGQCSNADREFISTIHVLMNPSMSVAVNNSEHRKSVLCTLHWLPVGFRVKFKVLLIVFKCLNSLGPSYLSELLQPYTPPRALRSADQLLLAVPKARLNTRGDRVFSVAAPRLWNSLPLSVRSSQSLGQFKSRLKTHLFSLAFNTS